MSKRKRRHEEGEKGVGGISRFGTTHRSIFRKKFIRKERFAHVGGKRNRGASQPASGSQIVRKELPFSRWNQKIGKGLYLLRKKKKKKKKSQHGHGKSG